MLRALSLKTKFFAGFAFFASGQVMLGLLLMSRMHKIAATYEELVKVHAGDPVLVRARDLVSTSYLYGYIAILIGVLLIMGVGFFVSRYLIGVLETLSQRLKRDSHQIDSASKAVSRAGQEFADGSRAQSNSLQSTAAAIDEMSAMLSKSAENAQRSQETTVKSHDMLSEGKRVLGEMEKAVEEIDRSNAEIMSQMEVGNREIAAIVQVIAEIGNRTKIINDIVFQTKLLSFNASVEAARAGEHGKGFSVVAEEVGKLAQMSGNAAKEISTMLAESIQKVEKIVDATSARVKELVQVGKTKVDAGKDTARQCGEVMDAIFESASDVGGMMNEITTATQEQTKGIQEITKAMAQLGQFNSQNLSATDSVAHGATLLAKQTVELRSLVEMLDALVNGQELKLPNLAIPASGSRESRSSP